MQEHKLNLQQRKVLDVIKGNPGVQNNDAKLIAAVWRWQGWNDLLTLEQNIMRVMRPDSVTRRRRELHEYGLITYSKEADQERTEAFIKERDSHSDGKAIAWLYDKE